MPNPGCSLSRSGLGSGLSDAGTLPTSRSGNDILATPNLPRTELPRTSSDTSIVVLLAKMPINAKKAPAEYTVFDDYHDRNSLFSIPKRNAFASSPPAYPLILLPVAKIL